MTAGNELQGVQALWCKARWWDEQSRAWLEQSTFPGFLLPSLAAGSMRISKVGRDVGPFPKSTEALRHSSPEPLYVLKTCTARITYCRQMGHSLMRFPHLVHVTMCPHSSSTQSMAASMQILHRLSSVLGGPAPPV